MKLWLVYDSAHVEAILDSSARVDRGTHKISIDKENIASWLRSSVKSFSGLARWTKLTTWTVFSVDCEGCSFKRCAQGQFQLLWLHLRLINEILRFDAHWQRFDFQESGKKTLYSYMTRISAFRQLVSSTRHEISSWEMNICPAAVEVCAYLRGVVHWAQVPRDRC